MKNFIKACLIAVLVFAVAGIVLLIVAAAGGVTRASIRLFSDQGRLSYGPVNIRMGDGFSVNIGERDVTPQFDGLGYVVTDEGTEMIYQHGVYQVMLDVEELYLDVAVGDIEILPSEDEYIYIDCDNDKFEIVYDQGVLRIGRVEEDSIGLNFRNIGSGVIYLPDNYPLKNVTMEVSAGNLAIDTPLSAKHMKMEVGAGNITIDEPLTADVISIKVGAGDIDGHECITTKQALEMEVNAGNISIDDMECLGTLYAECNMGNLEAEGKAYGDITAQCDVGNLTMDLIGTGEKYNYKLESSLGEVSVNDFDYAGIDSDVYLEGDPGAPVVALSCGMGNLELDIR